MCNLEELENSIDYHFKDKNLLLTALTHKSYKNHQNNERLEFLGDAVLDLLVGEFLYHKFPKNQEGDLSKMRAALVNEQSFTSFAQAINLQNFIRISHNEESNLGREKSSILSSAFEALIGAVYLESGIKIAKKITYKILEELYPKIDTQSLFIDYKTALQEITQARFNEIPHYELLEEIGPDHCKKFKISLLIQGQEYARAIGTSKKNAQQNCAKIAYQKIVEQEKI